MNDDENLDAFLEEVHRWTPTGEDLEAMYQEWLEDHNESEQSQD